MLSNKFTGKTMIFKNENGFYRTTISTKNKDGEWVSKGINVGFKKGVDLPDRTMIDIKNGWLTFDEYISKKDNQKKTSDFKIFILDFTVENQGIGTSQTSTNSSNDDIMFGVDTNQDDLPF